MTTGLPLLHLPEGFSYASFGHAAAYVTVEALRALFGAVEAGRSTVGIVLVAVSVVVTGGPFLWALGKCSLLGSGESRGDGLWWSPVEGPHDTAAPGSCGTGNRRQRDAPQSASQ